MILDGEVDLQAPKIEMVGLTKAPVVVEDLPQEEEEEEQEEEESGWGGFLDGLQLGLDLVGLIPGLGEIADLANAGISLARGDYAGAALSLAACIPFAGWGATGAKLGMKAQKAVTKGKKVAKATENATSATKKAIVKNKSPGNGRGKVRTAARNAKEDMSELEAVQKLKDSMLAKAMQKPAVQKTMEIGKEVGLELGMELLDEATGGVASLAFGIAGSRRGRKTGGSASGSGTGRSEPQATQKDRSPDKDQANEQKLRKVANGDSDYSGEVPKKGDTNKKSGGGNGQDTKKPPSKPPEGEGMGETKLPNSGKPPEKPPSTEGRGNVASYPSRTPEATAEAQNVVGELNKILGDGKRAPNPAVSVITHEDGTVSVGFSGEASPKNIETARQLENALNKKYGDKYTVKAEPMPTENLKIVQGGNAVGTCAESKVANAAHDNPSKITGMDTVWRSSKKENPYPYAEDSNQMNPCLTCSHNINIEEYMKYANANKR
ncbi:hypothetical protein ACSNN5_03025 [Brevibacillus formosus]